MGWLSVDAWMDDVESDHLADRELARQLEGAAILAAESQNLSAPDASLIRSWTDREGRGEQ